MCSLSDDALWAKWKDLEDNPPKPSTQETKPEEVPPKLKPDWDLILGM